MIILIELLSTGKLITKAYVGAKQQSKERLPSRGATQSNVFQRGRSRHTRSFWPGTPLHELVAYRLL